MATKRSSRSAARPPAGYDADAFPRFAVTVDIVILAVVDDALSVLLIRRKGAPFEDHWALPGGFKRPSESLDDAARRELLEETGVTAPRHLDQFKAYGDPGRDQRTNVVSIAYLAVVPEIVDVVAGSDAIDAQVWRVADALEQDLAFDHRQILEDAIEQAREQLENSGLATAFVGPTFTLSQLRGVYEAVWGDELDPGNFRRSLVAPSPAFVEPAGLAAPGPKGGRPPEVFRATKIWSAGSPVKRSKKRPPDE